MRRHPKVELSSEERDRLRQRVLEFMRDHPGPALVVTTGLDGKPRVRMMGAKHDGKGFTCYLLSVKPSTKEQELERDPEIRLIWHEFDVDNDESDQPLRFVEVRGRAEMVWDVPTIRSFPDYDRGPDGHIMELDDETIANGRYGIIVQPELVRIEGFRPGPRYPVYLKDNLTG
jgi:general stress protein 26